MFFTTEQWSDVMIYAWGWLVLVGAWLLHKAIREMFR